MDVSKLLRNVNNLNDYISATQDVINKFSNSKIHFNMSTILALNKIRSIEIEYFNKCDENGAALKILELMLRTPPSKTWGLLGKELVSLMQYWLDAIRKHLIVHNNHWWNFMSILLKYIQEISLKNPLLNNILVEEMTECLLDIATKDQPDVTQKYKIIQCLNKFCAESSREVRLALRSKFEAYFIKLSRIISSCGDVRTQLSILETLLRWLLPRQDLAVRKEASLKWFPTALFNAKAVDIFLKRPWKNFLKDARDFLNALNRTSEVVTSVLCRRFSVGTIVLISATDKKDYWIDLNCGSRCMSMILEPALLEVLGSSLSLNDSLVISEHNASSVQMGGDSEITITLTILDPQRVYQSNVLEGSEVSIAISTGSDRARVDRALRSIFRDKYQLLLDLKKPIKLSPRREASRRADNTSEDEARFSHPVEVQRRKHSGYIVRARNPSTWQSPSTASTSSLAMLREKLTAFPGYRFDKEPVSVCALPQLSSVTELSETDGQPNTASLSTLKLRSYGVCNKRRNRLDKSQSDTEGVREKEATCISPVRNEDDNSISCLLVATIGSASDSVINDTIERLPKGKDICTDSIVDMLAQEALNSTSKEEKIDSGFLNSDKVVQDKCIEEDTAISTVENSSRNNKSKKVSHSTTTDESNTEIIENTPYIVNVKDQNSNSNKDVKQTYDNQAIEEFFSQHFIETRDGDVMISPTLAKKINETSSESSEPFDFCPINVENVEDFNEDEIIECLNEIVDIVCKDFEKCSEYLNDGGQSMNDVQIILNDKDTRQSNKQDKPKVDRKAPKEIKLRFTNTKKQTKTRGRKKKLDTEVKIMSPIIERDSIIDDMNPKRNPEPSKQSDSDSPLIKRKRKLYSPKDDNLVNQRTGVHVSETEEDTLLPDSKINANTPKSLAASYKDIENIRRKSIRKLRDRKSRSAPSLSPRSKKMNDMFDNLKTSVNSKEKIILAKKTHNKQFAVYNFTSDSDDEDFQIKKNTKTLSRQTSKETAQGTRSRRRSTKVNYSELNNDSTEEKIAKNVKRKTTRQRIKKSDKKGKILIPKNDMIDERMREGAPEKLNTSLVIDLRDEEISEPKLQPTIDKPQMEIIDVENAPVAKKLRPKRNKTDLSTNKVKSKQNKLVFEMNSDRDNTESPLPGLLIETAQENKDADESITDLMIENLKNIDQEGTLPDLSELNNTQNLLSDTDHNNNSPTKTNVRDELIKDNFNKLDVVPEKKIKIEKTRKRNTKIVKAKNKRKNLNSECITDVTELNPNVINITDRFDVNSEKSIDTVGKSPITGHGDFDELPPDAKQLTETLKGRDLEVQDLNLSIKEYFYKLTGELNEKSTDSSNKSKKDAQEDKEIDKSSIVGDNAFEKSSSVVITRLTAKEMSKWLPPRYNSVFGSNQSSDSDTSTRKTRSYKQCSNNQTNFDERTKENKAIYKSVISPVKLYGEPDFKEKSIPSQDDDYVDRIKSMMTRKRDASKATPEVRSRTFYDLRKRNSSQDSSCNSPRVSKSSIGKESASVKRKSSPVFEVKKIRKTDDKASSVTAESLASSSSVHDWLKRNERDKLISQVESLDLSLKDSLENIIEKLDTTLVEIHHKTSKKFVNMFVDTQKHLNDLKERRHQMFRDTAMEVMSEVVKVMNDKFANFDRRSQELDEEFITNLKSKAQSLIHEDCKQKRVMVTLLKEDVQTVLEHMTASQRNVP